MINLMMREATLRNSLAARRRHLTTDLARHEATPAPWSRRRRHREPGARP